MTLHICELVWIKTLPKELQVEIERPMSMYRDNKATINIAHNLVKHDMTKHIGLDRQLIKKKRLIVD